MSETNLFKRKGVYYTRVQVDGHDQRRSLRTRSVVEARKRARKILAAVDECRLTGEARHPWKTAVVEWSAAMVGAVKPDVLKRYKISLRKARPVLDELHVDEIDTKVIAKLVKHRREQDSATNATIKRDLTAVSSVLGFCCGQGWIEANVAKSYDRSVIRERRDPVVLPQAEDIDALVAMSPLTFGLIIRTAQFTGMRQTEISTLERRQVRGKTVDLWKTKTDRPRAVPLDDRAAGALAGTVAHIKEPWVFHHDDGMPFIGVKSQFRDLMARAVKNKAVKRRFRFHDLRHWYAVDYLRGGGVIYDLQQILGHSTIKTTEQYLNYLTPEEQKLAKFGKPAHTRHSGDGSAHSSEPKKALSH